MQNLYTKLSKIQGEIGQVIKNQTNHYANFKYYQKQDIFNLIKPFLSKYNLAISYSSEPQILNDDLVIINYKIILKNGDNEADSLMFSDFTILDTSVRKGKGTNEQIRGKADTYFWKYALANIFLIPTKETDVDQTDQTLIHYEKQDDPTALKKIQNNLFNKYASDPQARQLLADYFKTENNKENIKKLIETKTLDVAMFLNK